MNVFIACTKTKAEQCCAAKEMYKGALFISAYKYAESLNGKIWILSAKYGLLHPNDIIAPYNKTLVGASEIECKRWAYNVYLQMVREKIDFKEDAVFLCGKNYYKYLITKFKKGSAPMAHMRIGQQQKFLKKGFYDEK